MRKYLPISVAVLNCFLSLYVLHATYVDLCDIIDADKAYKEYKKNVKAFTLAESKKAARL